PIPAPAPNTRRSATFGATMPSPRRRRRCPN
ncbi:uncharacterized protein METZ01_LOCUS376013, partial [marine metagenome]